MTAIIGGGISGLSAAYYALENPRLSSIVLHEASDRLGGWIHSKKTANGTLFEKGPRTIRPVGEAGQNTLILANRLGLSEKIVPVDYRHPATRNRLIYANNKLHLLPNSITSLFKVNSPFNRRLISIVWNDLFAKKDLKSDDSIYEFAERRFGKDVADYLISPMICGICAGNAKEISVKFLLKQAFELEQKYGSVTKGLILRKLSKSTPKNKMIENTYNENDLELVKKAKEQNWASWFLKDGLEEFPLKLEETLKSKDNVQIEKNSKCEQITFKADHAELIINGKVQKYERVISSLLSRNLAPLLQRQHPQLSRELDAIPSVTVAVVNLSYSKKLLPMKAFGFLIAPSENLPILGVIFDSCLHKDNPNTVLTIMMGGAWFKKYFGDSPSEEYLLSTARNQLNNILNINETPDEYDVAILNNCIPQYIVGHSDRLQRIQNYISAHKIPLTLCGSSYHGVGINDVILHI